MNSHRPFALAASLALSTSLAALLLAGCHIRTNTNGKSDNVDIGTPFGSMSVKTDKNVDPASTGLTPYPGATPVTDDSDNDAADVNMNFGSFHLTVKTATFRTSDPQDKVIAFYRNDLSRYGVVIACRDNQPVGQPTQTPDGLACDQKSSHEINVGSTDHPGLVLRAGSPQHQHVVTVRPSDGGQKIGLLLLNLPTGSSNGKQQSE